MSSTTTRAVRVLLASAAMFAAGAGPVLADQPLDAGRAFEHAAALLQEGKAVRARAMLLELTRPEYATALDDAQQRRAFELLGTAERRLRQADPMDLAVQRGELALLTDDLVEAERQAMTVLGDASAAPAVRQRAQAIIQESAGRRAALASVLGGEVDAAVAQFRAGKYAQAKAGLERIVRTGVVLDPVRQRTVESYRQRVLDLEQVNGQVFDAPVALALFGERGPEAASWILEEPGTDAPAHADASSLMPVSLTETRAAQPGDAGDVDVIEASRRFEAQSLLGEADRAFAERRLSEAMNKYARAANEFGAYLSEPDMQRARDRMNEIRVQLNAQGGPGDAIEGTLGDRALERDRVTATFDNLIEQANAALAAGDTTAARDRAAQARFELNRGRAVLAESDFEARTEAVERLISEINQREEELRREEAARQAAVLEAQTQATEAARQAERDERINQAIERVRQLQLELKYDEALQVVDQILFLDPNNPAGLLLRDVIQDTVVYRRYAAAQREKDLSVAEQNLQNQEALLFPEDLIEYPEDWPAISFRRGSPLDLSSTPADRATMSAMGEASGPVRYSDNFLSDVLDNIAERARVDVDVDWNSLEDVGVTRETPVTLALSNSTWTTVLDRVMEKVSDPALPARWTVQDGIVTVASDDVLRRRTVLAIYDINDLLFEVPYFDNAPEFDLSQVLQSGGGGGGQSPFSGGNTQADDRENRDERIQQLITLVQASVDPTGWTDLGGTTGTIQELNGNLIVTQTPRSHREIVGLLDRLRQVRTLQINVEARFLLVSESFFEQIGFDLDVYFNPNNEFAVNRVIDPSVDLSDYFDDNGRLVENVVGGALTDTDGDTLVDAPFIQPVFPPGVQGDEWSVIGTRQDSFGITNSLLSASSSFAADVLSNNPALGITGRFLDDIQVDFLIEATQADQRTVSLTAPRLTFMNGQRSFVAVGTQQTFVSDLTPVVSDSSVAFDPVITPISDGVVLDVEGVVSADRRYVTLTVITAIAEYEFDSDRDITLTGGAGGTGGSTGTGIAEGTIQVPITQTTQINTTVTIPDQGTVLLGGQRVVEEVEIESGVPVLSKIPILSRFFSNRADVKEERTLMVLIKPTILIQDEEEEKNFPGLLDQLGG